MLVIQHSTKMADLFLDHGGLTRLLRVDNLNSYGPLYESDVKEIFDTLLVDRDQVKCLIRDRIRKLMRKKLLKSKEVMYVCLIC